MPIFPQTFTDDKPIYYPQTWNLNKTLPQLYEEWKLTTEYFILSNLLQCILAGLWMWFITSLISAIYQIYNIYRLDDDDRIKRVNRKFVSGKFVISVGFICFVAFSITLMLFFYDDMTRYALVKGYFTHIGVKWFVRICKIGNGLYDAWRRQKEIKYENNQQNEED